MRLPTYPARGTPNAREARALWFAWIKRHAPERAADGTRRRNRRAELRAAIRAARRARRRH